MPDTIRAAIIVRIAALGLSQSELSRRCGGAPSQAKISQFLAGRDISTANLERIISALNLQISSK